MQPAITVAIIAAAASAVGWVVNYVLSLRSEKERARQAARLAHVGRQLELLYGPLAFLVYEGRRSFLDLLDTLGRNYIFKENEELSPSDRELWLFWVDNEFIPRNVAIKTLLSEHTNLVVGDHLPASYIRFLDHHNSWYNEHQRWKEQQVPYSWHSKLNWPQDFEDEVISTFEYLMKEHATLIGIVGGVPVETSKTRSLRLPRWRQKLLAGMAATMTSDSARSAASRSISVPISATCRRSRTSAGSHAQVPVSRTASNSRISVSRSPSRRAPRMNSSRSRSAGPYRKCESGRGLPLWLFIAYRRLTMNDE